MVLLLSGLVASAQTLKVTYGSKGVQTISFGNTLLEDVGTQGADAFHIWHMKSSDLKGNSITTGQYGWGESNYGESWDPTTHTETYTFSWGRIATQFVQNGNNLDVVVSETNNPDSGVIFDGAEIYPFTLHFPKDPAGFSGYSQYAITSVQPGVSIADFGTGVVTSVIPNAAVPIYGGWKAQGANAYCPIMSGTYPDGLANFLPHHDAPVAPGATFTYTVSLRFTSEGTAASATDAYSNFASTYPSQMTWSDRRIIGTAYLASSPGGVDITRAQGFPTNPRRYFNDPTVDITTATGLLAFQQRMLSQAHANATNARAMKAQGVITWDIEGEQYPQSTSYVCSPDQVASVAPEMETIVSDQRSGFAGMKLDDAYFRIMSDAGLKIGVCLRPQTFTMLANGNSSQNYLSGNTAIIANLANKARFANSRWGTTIFYVDSTVDANGGTLDPAIFQQLITDFPGFLFIPEESTPRYYAYTAPFYSFLFHTDPGTPSAIYNSYPHAFGVNLVNDVAAERLLAYAPQLTTSVANGDILMGHADYWQANNPELLAIYAAAGSVTPFPVQTTPSITWRDPVSVPYGTALTLAQLDAFASVAGTFVYSPAAGTILNAGTNTLLTTFTPADTTNYTSNTASVKLTVSQATPSLTWTTPSALPAGTPLSSVQLNAAASVPGTFMYTPAAGSLLATGTTTLTVLFTPTDGINYASTSASVHLTVDPIGIMAPSIYWSAPASIVYGTSLYDAQLNATANVDGTFSYSPAFGTLLTTGLHTLVTTFTPRDGSRYSTATVSVNLIVNPATPVLTWRMPLSITVGTALSTLQLNATASVPGTFTYSPGAGTLLDIGSSTLSVKFVPADVVNYSTQSASVSIEVDPRIAVPAGPLVLLTPTAGSVASGVILAAGECRLFLDAAGTFMMVDGNPIGTRRIFGPFLYELDTRTLSNGPHTLQLWGHDIGNNTTLSNSVIINVMN